MEHRRTRREAAIDHSPGLQRWVSPIMRRALKVAPDSAIGRSMRRHSNTQSSVATLRAHFACVEPRAKALGYILTPLRGEFDRFRGMVSKPPRQVNPLPKNHSPEMTSFLKSRSSYRRRKFMGAWPLTSLKTREKC